MPFQNYYSNFFILVPPGVTHCPYTRLSHGSRLPIGKVLSIWLFSYHHSSNYLHPRVCCYILLIIKRLLLSIINYQELVVVYFPIVLLLGARSGRQQFCRLMKINSLLHVTRWQVSQCPDTLSACVVDVLPVIYDNSGVAKNNR